MYLRAQKEQQRRDEENARRQYENDTRRRLDEASRRHEEDMARHTRDAFVQKKTDRGSSSNYTSSAIYTLSQPAPSFTEFCKFCVFASCCCFCCCIVLPSTVVSMVQIGLNKENQNLMIVLSISLFCILVAIVAGLIVFALIWIHKTERAETFDETERQHILPLKNDSLLLQGHQFVQTVDFQVNPMKLERLTENEE